MKPLSTPTVAMPSFNSPTLPQPPTARRRWYDGVSIWRLLLGAVCAWAGLAFVLTDLAFQVPFDRIPRATVAGRVTSVSVTTIDEHPVLDVAVDAQPVRFRVWDGLFADALAGDVPGELVPGAPVEVVVPREQLNAPRLSAPGRTPTVSVDALAVSGRSVLDLAASRRWHETNGQYEYWILLLMTVGAFTCTSALVLRIRRDRRRRVTR